MNTYQEVYQEAFEDELQKTSGVGSEILGSINPLSFSPIVGPISTIVSKPYTEKERQKTNKKIFSNLIPGVGPARLGRRIKTVLAGTAPEKEIKKKASDIYQEAFEDELQKIAALKSTPEEIALENKQEDELEAILKKRPLAHKIGHPAITLSGLGAGVAAKKLPWNRIGKAVGRIAKSKFTLPMAGLIAGVTLAAKREKTLPYWKKMDQMEKRHNKEWETLEKKQKN